MLQLWLVPIMCMTVAVHVAQEQPRPGELLHMSDPLAEEAEPPQSSAVSNTTSDVQAEVESYKVLSLT